MRVRAEWIQLALLTVFVAAAPGIAQQTISQYRPLTTPLFTERDLTDLNEAAALTPAQAEAARIILESATTEASAAVGAWQRECSKASRQISVDAKDEATKARLESEAQTKNAGEQKALQDKVRQIELGAMDDLRAILLPEQVRGKATESGASGVDEPGDGGWARFERSRRFRVTEEAEYSDGLPISPHKVLQLLKLEPDVLKAARSIVQKYESEVDPLALAQLKAMDDAMKQQEGRSEGVERAALDPPSAHEVQLRRLRVRALEELEKALSAEDSRRLLLIRVVFELGNTFSEPPSHHWRIVRISGLASLTAEQRQAMEELKVAADADALREHAAMLHELDRMAAGDGVSREIIQRKLFKAEQLSGKSDARFAIELESLLTPAQKLEVLMPSEEQESGDEEADGLAKSPWVTGSSLSGPPSKVRR